MATETKKRYECRDTVSGYSVVRSDGTYAEFLDREDAEEALQRLRSGEPESRYEWTEMEEER